MAPLDLEQRRGVRVWLNHTVKKKSIAGGAEQGPGRLARVIPHTMASTREVIDGFWESSSLAIRKGLKGMTGEIVCDKNGDCGPFTLALYQFTSADPGTFDLGKNPKRVYPPPQ